MGSFFIPIRARTERNAKQQQPLLRLFLSASSWEHLNELGKQSNRSEFRCPRERTAKLCSPAVGAIN